MKITIENTGYTFSAEQLLNAVLRFDLTPVPVTLELKVFGDEQGKGIEVGDNLLVLDDIRLTVVKKTIQDTDLVQGDRIISTVSYIALLYGCDKLIKQTDKAILLNGGSSFANAYRACGVDLPFAKDVPLDTFNVFFGKTPTFEIARRCSEEACVICYKDKKINAIRLKELESQEPILQLEPMTVQWSENKFLENALITNYITVNPDGSTIEDSITQAKSANFYPNIDTRRLKNLRTVLVRKGTVMRGLSPQFRAGDVFVVEQDKYVVLTAAHYFSTGSLGGEAGMFSKFWLSQVVYD